MKHLDFINSKLPFAFKCCTEEFTASELENLDKHGHWLTALALEVIKPESKKQQQFVTFAKKMSHPTTEFEKLWAKLNRLRKLKNPDYKLSATDLPKSLRKYATSKTSQTTSARALKGLMNKLRKALETGRSKTEIAHSIYSQWESGKQLSEKQIEIVRDIVSRSKPKEPKMITGHSKKDGSHRSN